MSTDTGGTGKEHGDLLEMGKRLVDRTTAAVVDGAKVGRQSIEVGSLTQSSSEERPVGAFDSIEELCHCLADPMSLISTCFCPCVVAGVVARDTGADGSKTACLVAMNSTLCWPLPIIGGYLLRRHYREYKGIARAPDFYGLVPMDLCVGGLCCWGCSLARCAGRR